MLALIRRGIPSPQKTHRLLLELGLGGLSTALTCPRHLRRRAERSDTSLKIVLGMFATARYGTLSTRRSLRCGHILYGSCRCRPMASGRIARRGRSPILQGSSRFESRAVSVRSGVVWASLCQDRARRPYTRLVFAGALNTMGDRSMEPRRMSPCTHSDGARSESAGFRS